jgi:hypothetical protein
MLLIILISALVIGALIVKTKLKKSKSFEPGLNYSHDELAPEATPEPSIVEAITVPAKPKKKPAVKNKPVVKTDAKKKQTKKVNKK